MELPRPKSCTSALEKAINQQDTAFDLNILETGCFFILRLDLAPEQTDWSFVSLRSGPTFRLKLGECGAFVKAPIGHMGATSSLTAQENETKAKSLERFSQVRWEGERVKRGRKKVSFAHWGIRLRLFLFSSCFDITGALLANRHDLSYILGKSVEVCN